MEHNSGNVAFDFWKGKGDVIFKVNSNNKDLASVVYVQRLTQALSCYHKASAHAITADQKSIIAEKLAITQLKCGQRLYENYTISASTLPKDGHQEIRLLTDHYLKESLIQYERAIVSYEDVNTESLEWFDKLEEDYISCMCLLWILHKIHHLETEKSFSHEIGRLEVLCQRTEGHFSRPFYNILIKNVMGHATELKNKGKYHESSQLLHDNQIRIEKAKKVLGSAYEVLKLDCDKLVNAVESMKAMQKGDACWTSVTITVDDILKKRAKKTLPDYILDAADWYKSAINFARLSNSPEIEAEAHVQLGRLYESKLADKSVEHYQIAAKIASKLPAETFKNQEWYQHCLDGLYRHQRLQNWQQNVNRESLRRPIRQQLSSQLTELAQKSKQPVDELLEFIYNKYPPKDCGAEQPKGTNMKINLKKALLHYHPDKQNVDRFGLHWIVLAEEITAILTSYLTRLFRT